LLLLQQLSSENILKAVGQEHPLVEHHNATTDDIDANKFVVGMLKSDFTSVIGLGPRSHTVGRHTRCAMAVQGTL
jgi:hypothetical protein